MLRDPRTLTQRKDFSKVLITTEQKRVIEVAIKLVETFRDANDIGETLSLLSEAVDALGYKGSYKEIE